MDNALPHQVEAAKNILAALSNNQRYILAVMPLGTGRTGVIELVTRELLAVEIPVVVLANLRIEIEQIKSRILTNMANVSTSNLQFLTTGQIAGKRHTPPIDVSGHVVIGVNSTFAASFTEDTRVGKALIETRAIVGFTSLATTQEYEIYGEPAYHLALSDAIDRSILATPNFNSFGPYKFGKDITATELEQALSDVMRNIGLDKCVFVCTLQSVLNATYDALNTKKPAQVTLARMSRDEYSEELNAARNSTWVVTTPSFLAGYHITRVQHVVLLNRFGDVETLLRATQPLLGTDHGQVWDLAGNIRLWMQLGIPALGEGSPNSSELTNSDQLFYQKWVRPRADGAASRDLMDRERLIHVMRGIIKSKSEDRSLAIGLFGRWGSGKSTIINLLKQRMSNTAETLFIEFNAWENEHVSSMPAALADAITQQMYQARKGPGRFWLLMKHRFFINDALLSCTLFALIFAVVPMIPIEALDPKLRFAEFSFAQGKMRNWITIGLTVFVAVRLAWKSTFTQGLRSLLKQIGYIEHLGLARRLRDDLRNLFRARDFRLRDYLPVFVKNALAIKSPKPLTCIVVIDDLDRCSRGNVWNVVEATRLIAEFKNVVLVFSVDYRLLFDAVAERLYEKSSDLVERERLSREFLAKILQLSVQLPEPSSTAVARYISEALFETSLRQHAAANMVAANEDHELAISAIGDQTAVAPGLSDLDADEIVVNVEQDDDYIDSTPAQAKIFQDCTKAFGINNPRSLLRLYNSLTLIKGMHPEVGEHEREYQRHAFYVFLTEFISINNKTMEEATIILAEKQKVLDEAWNNIINYGIAQKLFGDSQQKSNATAEQRARATSLPVR